MDSLWEWASGNFLLQGLLIAIAVFLLFGILYLAMLPGVLFEKFEEFAKRSFPRASQNSRIKRIFAFVGYFFFFGWILLIAWALDKI